MTHRKPLILMAIMAALVAGGAIASAASPAETISARQSNFKKMGGAMKVLKDELAGGGDKAKMLTAARTIAANNIVNSGAMVIGAIVYGLLVSAGVSIADTLFMIAAACLVSAWIAWRLHKACDVAALQVTQ